MADGQPLSKNQTREFAHRSDKRQNNVNNEKQREEATQHRRENDGKARQQETEEIRRRYGDLLWSSRETANVSSESSSRLDRWRTLARRSPSDAASILFAR
ncbi:hypothetical protein HO173_002405 [Letharia columbiana]|uniref:Uncharacterized protein n=1 Tax=Letharia columbiana TaxID=112416 RepID=A0A8H6L8Q0_9LECA|nr:uncharacterized protein HO173_002405 [Letharia columbiana]KAF6239858.1 hypothetical protein HO173_002405 [Letharia columbiana]